jgi:hypothetical protein
MLAIHELINELPDSHYVLLKFLAAHLHRFTAQSSQNQTTADSLAAIFGPLLVREGDVASDSLRDLPYRTEVVQVVTEKYREIFEF